MNCEKCFLVLDEYVENELNENAASRVAAHLAACAVCAGYYEDLKLEQKIYSQYLLGVEANPALWAGVQAAIEQTPPGKQSLFGSFYKQLQAVFAIPRFKPHFAVVPFALLISIAVVTGIISYNFTENVSKNDVVSQPDGSFEMPPPPVKPDIQINPETLESGKNDGGKEKNKITVARAENRGKNNAERNKNFTRKTRLVSAGVAATTRKSAVDKVVENAERQYINAIATLSSDIEKQQKQLPPKTIALLEQSDMVINQTRRAVQRQPRDPIAIQYMTTAYSKKVELLRMIASK